MSIDCAEIVDTLERTDLVGLFRGGENGTETLGSPARTGTTVTLGLVSMALLLFGARFLRPLGALTLGGVAFFASIGSTSWLVCEGRLGAAAVAGLSAALLTCCLLRTGLFLIGGTAFGLSAYIIYTGSVSHAPRPIWGGRSWLFWAVLGVSTVTGAVLVYVRRKSVFAVASSMLGSVGILLALQTLSVQLSSWSVVLLFCGTTAAGVGAQYAIEHRKAFVARLGVRTARSAV